MYWQTLVTLPLILLLAGMLSGCQGNAALGALNAVTPDSGYTLSSDLAYGSDARQTMDIYRPDVSSENAHVVVFVYGGAWRKGVKDDYAFIAHALAKQGHWLVVPDYRLFPAATFPAFVDDLATSINALPALLGEEISDGDKPLQITLMGHSSGAHSAALIAADTSWLDGASVKISKLIAMSGPYDLPLDNPEVQPVFAGALNSDIALPIAQIDEQHPPSLLIHGMNDNRVLPLHTERYSAALEAAGIDTTVLWIEGSGHAAPLTGLAELLPDNGVLSSVFQFLAKRDS
ncbi:MAG: alpha/beta hydrolase [Granulosicoccus sp.]